MHATLPERPLVGRTGEVEALHNILAAAPEGQGSVLLVRGPTGVGKSRLARVATEAAELTGLQHTTTQGFRIDQSLPYGLWANACRPLVADLNPERLAALTRGRAPDLRWILPPGDSSEAPGADAAPGEFRTRVHWAFLELLRGLTRERGLTVVLDDLHWADPSSLDLLHFLARHIGTLPLCVICTENTDLSAQQEYFRSVRPELTRIEEVRSLELDSIGVEDCRDLLEETFGISADTAGRFARRLHRQAAGNPLMIEEILNSLVDSGTLFRRSGSWLGWETESIAIPDSVRELVTARLSALTEDARRVTNVIAVSDSGVGYRVLRFVLDASEDELLGLRRVERCADAQPSSADGRSPGGGDRPSRA